MHLFDTARLHVRRLSEADEAVYCGLYTDADTMRHIAEPLSQERAARAFRKAMKRSGKQCAGPSVFVMLENVTQRAIGLCGFQPLDTGLRRIEIGMMLLPEARAKGYATEALAALVTVAFSTFPIDSVWVQYSREHTVAERLVISVGFNRCADEGLGNERDAKCVWSIDRSSWCSNAETNNRGEDDVECDRLS